MTQTLVILPTYNESENIEKITAEILLQLPNAGILIVDDDSPDGTGSIADELAAAHPSRVSVLHRPRKEGLGRAYLHAFSLALETDAQVFIQMDADFSHPPRMLPQFLAASEQHDIVLGSRYMPGGGTKDWGILRRLLSRGGNRYAKWALNLKISDLTGGFKAFRRPVVEFLVKTPPDSTGYNFQIETTARALAAGFNFTEIPFVFTERKRGASKMDFGIIWEAFRKTYRLRRALQPSALSAPSAIPEESAHFLSNTR